MKRLCCLVLSLTFLAYAAMAESRPKVVAHRGYWKKDGSAQNSRASLQFVQELGVYASETDVWLTTDGRLVVNHDETYDSIKIQDTTSVACWQLVLPNGENMPLLDDLLQILASSESPTRLIIEIKQHSSLERNVTAACEAVRLVAEYGVADRVEYISFDWDACVEIIRIAPDAFVAYLNGDKTPQELKSAGFTGMDYSLYTLRHNPGWIEQAHSLGLSVNVWTIRKVEDAEEMIESGADFLTTDIPEEVVMLLMEKACQSKL